MSASLSRAEQLHTALAAVRARIDAARTAAGRADAVALLVVTKTFPVTDIDLLADLGVRAVGENRDQEARDKRSDAVHADALRWHMIGQVQRKKAASLARWADVVESVDRPEVVDALERGAQAAGRRLEVLVQVSLDLPPRAERGGADPSAVLALAARVEAASSLDLRGVMAVAPHPGDPGEAFARLAAVAAEVRAVYPTADRVSAGMSADLEAAIAHGATQVRLGGAILGERPTVH